MISVAAILLAAGRSQRYRDAGGPEASKLLADFHGEPVVRASARAALASGAAPLIVVTGHAREAVEAALSDLSPRFAHNPDFASGLASSLRVGVAAAPADAAGALALLGDMPAVSPGAIDALIAAFAARPDALAVAPTIAGQRGNPVLLARGLFARIAALQGDEGARRLLRELDPALVIDCALDDAALQLDVDTPEQLARARALGGAARPQRGPNPGAEMKS